MTNKNIMEEIFNIKDKLPSEGGSYLVYAPKSFPKNSRWVVAEYYPGKGFYSEASDNFMEDVTHWCELPKEPKEEPKDDPKGMIIYNLDDLELKYDYDSDNDLPIIPNTNCKHVLDEKK